jgi:hypothetical protein
LSGFYRDPSTRTCLIGNERFLPYILGYPTNETFNFRMHLL